MSKLSREIARIFAEDAPAADFGIIGSFKESGGVNPSSPRPSTDSVANTPAFRQGLNAVVELGNLLPTLEEFNSLLYSVTKWLKYQFQEGIAEYSPGETYYENSVVKFSGRLYMSVYSGSEGFSGVSPNAANAASYWGAMKLAPNSVDNAALQSNSVTTAKIADGNVTTQKLADSAVTTNKLYGNSITVPKLAQDVIALIEGQGGTSDGSVTMDKLAPDVLAYLQSISMTPVFLSVFDDFIEWSSPYFTDAYLCVIGKICFLYVKIQGSHISGGANLLRLKPKYRATANIPFFSTNVLDDIAYNITTFGIDKDQVYFYINNNYQTDLKAEATLCYVID